MLVLPLILSRFSTEEIVLWYLFNSIIILQLLADLGFSPTFSRVIAYSVAGASKLEDYRDGSAGQNGGAPNWGLIDRIWSIPFPRSDAGNTSATIPGPIAENIDVPIA